MLRSFLAFLGGFVVAMLVISGIELVCFQLYPAPPGFDWKDPKAVEAFVTALPLPALLMVTSAWCLGAFFGAAVPAWQANHRLPAALLIGVLISVATWFNAQGIPHPQWMLIAGIVGPVVMAWLATVLVKARKIPLPPPGKWPDHAIRR